MQQLRPSVNETAMIHIVGQGLAGAVIAMLLADHGYKVRVYDNGYRTSSSMVAAGMWNPLSFVNLKRSWLANELLPELQRTYLRLESLLDCSFYHPRPLLRIFPDAGSANLWEEKTNHPEVAAFINQSDVANSDDHYLQPHGHGMAHGAGWLDIPLFLNAARSFMIAAGSFEEREVSTADIERWHQQGDWVIQCTGWKPMADSFWKDAPIHASKGQLMTLKIDGLTDDYMCNFSKFIIPLGHGLFRAGSTYEHGALDAMPSEAANEILNDVEACVKHPFSVVDHKAGFRPTTIDRQPVLGRHDQYERLCVFNGFGSRGVMLVPFFGNHLIDHLLNGTPIMKAVDWRRFEQRRLKKG
jgi:glycine/D-amino acid oxidase-like deaminating enzyme